MPIRPGQKLKKGNDTRYNIRRMLQRGRTKKQVITKGYSSKTVYEVAARYGL